jgi:hypothetical protein
MYDQNLSYLGSVQMFEMGDHRPDPPTACVEINPNTYKVRITTTGSFQIGYSTSKLLYADPSTNSPDVYTPMESSLIKGSSAHYSKGIVWNGLTGVTESPDGAEPNDLWADNIKYASMRSAETFGATIEAYAYPDEFGACDGIVQPIPGICFGQQRRTHFGFAYRTKTQNDDEYKIHLIYNATASPAEKSYETLNDSPDAITFSWEITTTPLSVVGYKPVSTIVLDSSKISRSALTVIEKLLFGDSSINPVLLSPEAVIQIAGSEGAQIQFVLPDDEPDPDDPEISD